MPRAVFDSDHESRLQALRDMIAAADEPQASAAVSAFVDEHAAGGGRRDTGGAYRITGTESDSGGHFVSWVCESTAQAGRMPCPKAVLRRVEASRDLKRRSFSSLDDLKQTLERLEPGIAWSRTVDLLRSQDRTAKELLDRLTGEGFTAQAAHEVIERARRCGYIDDARYGAAYVRTHQRKGWGRAKIERGLGERGVDTSCIEGYPEAFFGAGDEMARAQEALAGKRVPETKPVEKLARFLIGRGFSPSMALRAAKERVSSCG